MVYLLVSFYKKVFINRDISESQTFNRYAYVNGKPISYIDPFGLVKFANGKILDEMSEDFISKLDVIGYVPFIGNAADGISGLLYFSMGDTPTGMMYFAFTMPGYGDVARGGVKGTKAAVKVTTNFTAKSGYSSPLLDQELAVGTYSDLIKHPFGKVGDNLTPHHMPSDKKMSVAGVSRKDGVSMNMEQPHPGSGGRHRDTFIYGKSGKPMEDYMGMSYRDALAFDIKDAKRIYKADGLYGKEVREGLRGVIRLNKELYAEIFKK